jgi:hypothetical protein
MFAGFSLVFSVAVVHSHLKDKCRATLLTGTTCAKSGDSFGVASIGRYLDEETPT